MTWAQYTLLAIFIADLGYVLALHGSPKDGEHNFWASLFAATVIISLLYAAGFFRGAA